MLVLMFGICPMISLYLDRDMRWNRARESSIRPGAAEIAEF